MSAPSKTASPVVFAKSASSSGSRDVIDTGGVRVPRIAAVARQNQQQQRRGNRSDAAEASSVEGLRQAGGTCGRRDAVERPVVDVGARLHRGRADLAFGPAAAYSRPANDPLWIARRNVATSAAVAGRFSRSFSSMWTSRRRSSLRNRRTVLRFESGRHRMQNRVDDRGRGPAVEGAAARDHLVEHETEREDVRPPIERVAHRLLG